MILALMTVGVVTAFCKPKVVLVRDFVVADQASFSVDPRCPPNGVTLIRFKSKLGGRIPTMGHIELNRTERFRYSRLVPVWWKVEYQLKNGDWECIEIARGSCTGS